MRPFLLFLAYFGISLLKDIPVATAKYRWPSVQYEHLEGLLYEGIDMNGFQTAQLAESCKRRSFDDSPNATTVTAEWLRLAYHDMATYNVTDGTGGMDSSIYYELSRPENVGPGMMNTAFDFAPSSNPLLSRADLIALGVVWGIASCNGPVLPFRGGRKDALQAGRPGVPEPQQSLEEHTESFRIQGFTPTEMIALVACGHTVGAVRNSDFPTIVPPNPDEEEDNLQFFDTTDAFDTIVVSEYLKGTTRNPLVVNANDTVRSDFRIFSSDRNVTMRRLNSSKQFGKTCANLLTRMIDTVPRGVQLTDEILPIPFKVTVQFMFIDQQLVFNVRVRVLNPKGAPKNRRINMIWCDRRGPRGGCAGGKAMLAQGPTVSTNVMLSPVATALGFNFTLYEFAVPVAFERSVGSFWFEVSDSADKKGRVVIENNGGAGYWAPDDTMVFEPVGIANLKPEFVFLDGQPKPYYAAVGIHNSVTVNAARVSAFDSSYLPFDVEDGPRQPFNATFDLALNQTMPPRAGYSFYTAEIMDALSLSLALDFGATFTGEKRKRLGFVFAKCAERVSLGLPVPALSESAETHLSLLANGTRRH